jgi:hypothetical protein
MNQRYFGAFLILITFAASTARAQKNDPPSGQFGAGIYLMTNYLPNGFTVTYAIDSSVQFESELSLSISASSPAIYLVAPFARYLFPDLFPGLASPFVQGGIQLYSPGTGTQVGIFLGAGVAYFVNHQLGIHGDVDVVNHFFSTLAPNFGWFVFRIGADWFF